jgi:hypothetical protein
MRGRIRKSYMDAEKAYCSAAERNIGFGLWSTYRHSFTKTDGMEVLEKALTDSKTDDDALVATLQHLLDINATHNNHSFNSYLIDKLRRFVGEIAWDNTAKLNQLLADTIKTIEEKPSPAKPTKIVIDISHVEYDPAEIKKDATKLAIDVSHEEYVPDATASTARCR